MRDSDLAAQSIQYLSQQKKERLITLERLKARAEAVYN